MATMSIKIPDEMKRRVEEMSREGMYQSDSEYIRDAIRRKLEKDNGLTPAEEKELLQRMRDVEGEGVETVPLEEVA